MADIGDNVPLETSVDISVEQSLYTGSVDENTLSVILPEDFVESLIACNPSLLSLGSLNLVDQQLTTPHGRIDLLFEDENGAYIVVECKKGKLSDSDIIQLKDYLSWASKEYPNRKLKGLLVCHDVSPRQVNAIEMDKAHGYDINIRTYECLFRMGT